MFLTCAFALRKMWWKGLRTELRLWGTTGGTILWQTSSNAWWLRTCWEPGGVDAFHEEKVPLRENKRTFLLGTLPLHGNTHDANTSICFNTQPSSTFLPPYQQILWKQTLPRANHCFPEQRTFLFQSQQSPPEILGKAPGMCEKKPIICCLSWHVFRPQGGYEELRVLCISVSQSSSADFLNIMELGHFNLLAYSFCFHFNASYHCRRKARWLKHPIWLIKLNCSPSLMGRSPCRYQRAGTGIYCWLAAGSAGSYSDFPHGILFGCYLKQDLQIHQLGPDTRLAAMQRLNHL